MKVAIGSYEVPVTPLSLLSFEAWARVTGCQKLKTHYFLGLAFCLSSKGTGKIVSENQRYRK